MKKKGAVGIGSVSAGMKKEMQVLVWPRYLPLQKQIMTFTSLLFLTILFVAIPFFAVYVQTIKNLLVFMLIIFAVCINLMLLCEIEFFPIFFMLIYIGAIVVTVLFVVLSFDLRTEYTKIKYEPRGVFNSCVYFIVTGLLCFGISSYEKILWGAGKLDDLDRVLLYNACWDKDGTSKEFCGKFFGKKDMSKGLYHSIAEQTNDLVVISDNLYTTYAVLFLVLGIVLTIALLCALTILKNDSGPRK